MSAAASASTTSGDPIVVVGGGLAGAMFALMMARRGYPVEVFEKRPDFRLEEDAHTSAPATVGDGTVSHLGHSVDPTKRSINLALSKRGQDSLAAVGVLEQAIYSASRSLLNRSLLDACDKLPNVRVHFGYSLRSVDGEGGVSLDGPAGRHTLRARLVVGADGAYSAVRNAMLRLSRMDFMRQYIEHGYKELNMPPVNGEFAMPVANALHIWPRHQFMMIALPNPDKTFTCTLFMPWDMLERLDADTSLVRPFFEEHFPDSLPLIPEIERQFQTHPSGALVLARCNPWNYKDKIMLVGDAAHATVPFYGQGANAAFEDCLFFTEVLEREGGDLSKAVYAYAKERKPAGDGLQDLSLDNYIEMRHKTASSFFLLRKQVEGVLQWLMPETWIPQYSMVAFTRIPYHEVIARAERQDRILTGAALAILVGAGALAAVGAYKASNTEAARGMFDRLSALWRRQ